MKVLCQCCQDSQLLQVNKRESLAWRTSLYMYLLMHVCFNRISEQTERLAVYSRCPGRIPRTRRRARRPWPRQRRDRIPSRGPRTRRRKMLLGKKPSSVSVSSLHNSVSQPQNRGWIYTPIYRFAFASIWAGLWRLRCRIRTIKQCLWISMMVISDHWSFIWSFVTMRLRSSSSAFFPFWTFSAFSWPLRAISPSSWTSLVCPP